MRSEWRFPACLLLLALAAPAPAQTPDEPLLVGGDVPAPKRVEFVQPVYPPEAAARGLRGIVILSLIIDEKGEVADVEVVRSIPPFDAAAVAAVRQWRYEPTKIDGKPVQVRLTVPISFLLELPKVTRQDGIPELRSGARPPFPPETEEVETVSAELSLAPDGQVATAQVLEGNSPWSEALIAAVRTWRFDDNDLGPGVQMSFRVEARFVPAGDGEDAHVSLQLTGLRRSESRAAETPDQEAPAAATEPAVPPASEPAATPSAPAAEEPAAEPATEEATAAPAEEEPAPEEPVAAEPVAEPASSTAEPAAAEPATPTAEPAAAEPAQASPAPAEAEEEPAAEPEAPSGQAPPEAPDTATEVLGGPAEPAEPAEPVEPPAPEEPGVSSVRGVFLEPGVPDLGQGRRPSPPPFARMQGVEGMVRVRFAVDAAGQSYVSAVEGPDELRPAARAAVESWLFTRQSAERIYLVAELTYDATSASAVVKRER